MRKKPHSLQAREREEREDGLKGWERSNTGSSTEVLVSGIILSVHMENEIVCSVGLMSCSYI